MNPNKQNQTKPKANKTENKKFGSLSNSNSMNVND